MGRYLNILSMVGVESAFYKYTFGTQPSEIDLICELPLIGEEGIARIFVDEDDRLPALFVSNAQQLSEYLDEWLAAYEMEDEFMIPAYGEKSYLAELPTGASEDFPDMVAAIAQQLSFTNGECFIWEN